MRSIPREAVEVSDPKEKHKNTGNEPGNFGANAMLGFGFTKY